MPFKDSLAAYRTARREIVAANEGSFRISLVGLLPNAPDGVWEAVSTTLAALDSPPQFLSHLCCELVLDRRSEVLGERPISLDGFLGNAGGELQPALLIPAIALWLASPDESPSVAREFVHTVELWELLTRRQLSTHALRLGRPNDLQAFVPWGRVPRRALGEEFVQYVTEGLENRWRHPSRCI